MSELQTLWKVKKYNRQVAAELAEVAADEALVAAEVADVNADDAEVEAELPPHIHLSFDGMVLELP